MPGLFLSLPQTLLPPRSLGTGAIALSPHHWGCPLSSSRQVQMPQLHLESRQHDGGKPEAGSLERAALLPKDFPTLVQPLSSHPCSAACLPGAPDLGRQTLPSGFWRQEVFSRKQLKAQVSLLLSHPIWKCHLEGQAGCPLPKPTSQGWVRGRTRSGPENTQLFYKPKEGCSLPALGDS